MRAELAARVAPARTFCLEAADGPCLSNMLLGRTGKELGRSPPWPMGRGRDDGGGAISFAVKDWYLVTWVKIGGLGRNYLIVRGDEVSLAWSLMD